MVSLSYDVAEFDMIGLDPAIANAIRRVLIAEVIINLIDNYS